MSEATEAPPRPIDAIYDDLAQVEHRLQVAEDAYQAADSEVIEARRAMQLLTSELKRRNMAEVRERMNGATGIPYPWETKKP